MARFIGHAVYGSLLGLVHAALNHIWIGLFIASDPLKGMGTRTLRSLAEGAVGGLLFSLIMIATGGCYHVSPPLLVAHRPCLGSLSISSSARLSA